MIRLQRTFQAVIVLRLFRLAQGIRPW